MATTVNPGEDKAWKILASLNSAEVCRRAKVSYDDASRSFRIQSFGMGFDVSPEARTISSASQRAAVLLGKLGYFFRLSVLWYLVSAKDIDETGRLVNLGSIKGGDAFSKGTHVLPLEPLAHKFGKDREAFIRKASGFGGELVKQADVSLRLLPLPRIPVVLSLWLEDEEFPARAGLFLDSTCELQAAADILWSIAMMSVLLLMEDSA